MTYALTTRLLTVVMKWWNGSGRQLSNQTVRKGWVAEPLRHYDQKRNWGAKIKVLYCTVLYHIQYIGTYCILCGSNKERVGQIGIDWRTNDWWTPCERRRSVLAAFSSTVPLWYSTCKIEGRARCGCVACTRTKCVLYDVRFGLAYGSFGVFFAKLYSAIVSGTVIIISEVEMERKRYCNFQCFYGNASSHRIDTYCCLLYCRDFVLREQNSTRYGTPYTVVQ